MRSILFLDRDGVLNADAGYTHVFDPQIVYEDIAALGLLRFDLKVVVTNQSGINRGYYDQDDLHVFMRELRTYCAAQFDVFIDDYFFCPHLPLDNCECRKPKPFMFFAAMKKYDADPMKCMMIGDRLSDIDAAVAAGIPRNFLVDRNQGHAVIRRGSFTSVNSLYEIAGCSNLQDRF